MVVENNDRLYLALKKRVEPIIKKSTKKVQAKFYFKATVLFSLWIVLYFFLLNSNNSFLIVFNCYLFLGVLATLIIVNVCHDAIHGCASKIPLINRILTIPFNLLGANSRAWSISHNIHHNHTNIENKDKDLNFSKYIKFTSSHKSFFFQKYQYVFAFVLYSLGTLSTVFYKDFFKIFYLDFYKKQFNKIQLIELFTYKILHILFFIIIPYIILDIEIMYMLLFYFIYHLTEGLVLITIFQLAHLGNKSSIIQEEKFSNLSINRNTWAKMQISTTANYACNSKLISNIFGGQNFQIEHHLFRNINHCHYPNISKIIKKTIEEFELEYQEYKSLTCALRAHISVLKEKGSQ